MCVCVCAFCDSLLRESISSSTTSRKVREGLADIINISIRSTDQFSASSNTLTLRDCPARKLIVWCSDSTTTLTDQCSLLIFQWFRNPYTHMHTCMHAWTHTIHSLVHDTDLEAFIFTDFGKKFMKSINLSPDGFLQLAFQLAYYK